MSLNKLQELVNRFQYYSNTPIICTFLSIFDTSFVCFSSNFDTYVQCVNQLRELNSCAYTNIEIRRDLIEWENEVKTNVKQIVCE